MVICVDLGATEIKVAPVKEINGIITFGKADKVPTNANLGKQGILNALKQAISMHLCPQTEGIAIASAGDVDTLTSTITYATDNLPGMTGFNFVDFCDRHFSLKARAINDAHSALLGEMMYGAGRNYLDKSVAMLTLGSGVGGAFYRNGIVANADNDYGRFGHICLVDNGIKCTCGKRGCVEMYLSGRAIHRDAQSMGIDDGQLFDKYATGNPLNCQYVEQLRDYLRQTLDKVYKVNAFDVCIIGGGVADWMAQHFDSITAGLGYNIVRASLGNSAGIYGAYAHYINSEDLQ